MHFITMILSMVLSGCIFDFGIVQTIIYSMFLSAGFVIGRL